MDFHFLTVPFHYFGLIRFGLQDVNRFPWDTSSLSSFLVLVGFIVDPGLMELLRVRVMG